MRPAKETEGFLQLHAAYREAWQRFTSKVQFWQCLVSIMEAGSAIGVAEDEIRQAELEYRTARNRLAEYMLARSPEKPDVDPRMRSRFVPQSVIQEQGPRL